MTGKTLLATRSVTTGNGSTGSISGIGALQLSDDGQSLLFPSTGGDLVANDLNATNDVFVFDPTDLPTPALTPTLASTPIATSAATPSRTPTMTLPTAPVATSTPASMIAGDCNRDNRVTVDELVTIVAISKNLLAVNSCRPADTNNDNTIEPAEIEQAISNALVS